MKGKTSAGWTCTWSATAWRSPTGASAPQIETILADHRSQLTEYDRRLGDDRSRRRCATTTSSAARRSRQAIARETRAAAVAARGDHRKLVREPHHPAGRGHARPAGRRDPRRRLQQGEREAARRPASRSASAPSRAPTPRRRPAPRRRPPGGTRTTGTAACGGCHAPALAFWKTTKHARALSALARIGRDKDPSCVGCHVTGYLQPGGPTRRRRVATSGERASRTSGARPAHGSRS